MSTTQFTPALVYNTCRCTYRAIDIRNASSHIDGNWQNIITVIRLTNQSVKTVRDNHQTLNTTKRLVKSNALHLTLHARPSKDWNSLCEELANKTLRLGKITTTLRDSVIIGELKNYLSAPYHTETRHEEWPELSVIGGPNANTPHDMASMQIPASNHGYEHAEQAISTILDIERSAVQSSARGIHLHLPIYARITTTAFDTSTNQVSVTATNDRRLGRTKLHAIRYDPKGNIQENQAMTTAVTRVSREEEALVGTTRWHTTTPLSLHDRVTVSLTHPTLGELQRQTRDIHELVSPKDRNLLAAALAVFCPLADLDGYLQRLNAPVPPKPNPSRQFEQHLTWLLSLVHCSPIHLGEREHLYLGQVRHCSVDIIATLPAQDTLLLVNATVSAPKQGDYDNLSHAKTVVAERLGFSADELHRIIPILVTNIRTGQGSGRSIDDWALVPSGGVVVVDGERLHELINTLDHKPTSLLRDTLLHA